MIRKLFQIFLETLNRFVPVTKDKVIFVPFPNTEPGSIRMANFIVENYNDKKVYYVADIKYDVPEKLLNPKVNIIRRTSRLQREFLLNLFSAEYIFHSNGLILNNLPSSQTVINLWHGLLYKNVGMLLGRGKLNARYTVGTSEASQIMFSKAFGVPQKDVTKSGYPRNDSLLKGKAEKEEIIQKLGLRKNYRKIILWMPTYRKSVVGDFRVDGTEVGNPFYIKNFDVQKFNSLLKEQDALCIVKPHPMAPILPKDENVSNILFVDNHWIYEKGLDLYEFVGATDILISDVSSIIIDYILLDQPIICISEDFEAYKNSRGFYFEDTESKIPTAVLKTSQDFFNALENLLVTGEDPYTDKRLALKKFFFDHYDDKSTERLAHIVFGNK